MIAVPLLCVVAGLIWPKFVKTKFHEWSLASDQHLLMAHWDRDGKPLKKSFTDGVVFWLQGQPMREELFQTCGVHRKSLMDLGFLQTKTFSITNSLTTENGFQAFCNDAMTAFNKNVYWSLQDWAPTNGTVTVTDRPENFPLWQARFNSANNRPKP
jgi:hypothetical protein